MSLYRVYKMASKEELQNLSLDQIYKQFKNSAIMSNAAAMCNTPAYAHVPSKLALKILNDGKEIPIYERPKFEDLWEEQETLTPVVGYTVYFISNSMDAGWFKTSSVVDFEKQDNGDVLITTLNSVYLAELATDCEVENEQ